MTEPARALRDTERARFDRASGPRPAVRLLALLPVLVAACLAPRPEPEGGAEDLGRMMGEAGARPVTGTADAGPAEPLAGDSTVDEEVAREQLEEAEAQRAAAPARPVVQSPYIRFGERIIVREIDGVTIVTKPYALPIGRPEKIVQLLDALEPFPARDRAGKGQAELGPFDVSAVEYEILAAWDSEYYTDFTVFEKQGAQSTKKDLSDLLVVTAVPDMLERFEDFLDLFAGGGIPQIELEAKIIEIVETDTLDYGGTGSFLFGSNNFVRGLDVSLPNVSDSAEAILTLGAVQDQVVFDAILEAVKGWQNVTIETRPKTVVRAGGVASINTSTKIPFLEFKTLDAGGFFTVSTKYEDIGTQLWISPRPVGSNTLALDVQLQGSQRVGTQAIVSAGSSGSSTSQPIEVPVIAYRNAKTVVHLQPGQTLVIGGLTQEREQEISSKIPILGDIPLIGLLFRSSFRTTERQHVLFAISPRIIQNSDFDSDL